MESSKADRKNTRHYENESPRKEGMPAWPGGSIRAALTFQCPVLSPRRLDSNKNQVRRSVSSIQLSIKLAEAIFAVFIDHRMHFS